MQEVSTQGYAGGKVERVNDGGLLLNILANGVRLFGLLVDLFISIPTSLLDQTIPFRT
jgi:hypothetical protein